MPVTLENKTNRDLRDTTDFHCIFANLSMKGQYTTDLLITAIKAVDEFYKCTNKNDLKSA